MTQDGRTQDSRTQDSRTQDSRPSTSSLIGDAIRQATELFTTEVALVRLEASEKITLALASVVSLFAAAIFVIVALILLLQGAVELLVAQGLAPFVASFAIGGGIGLIALIAILVAIRNLRLTRLKPSRTLGQIKATTDAARGRTS